MMVSMKARSPKSLPGADPVACKARIFPRFAWAALLVCAAAGCNQHPDAQFVQNRLRMAANEVPGDIQVQIAEILAAMFGTPNDPFVPPESGLDVDKLRMAAGPVWSDELGIKHGLYRRHCAHCHGITGNGKGPTAAFLNPYPRDYRPGLFKMKSTERAAKPTLDNLRAVLREGIAGTAMPSFKLLPSDEIDVLAEYVKYLSMRGQMEEALVRFWFDEVDAGELIPEIRDVLVDELFAPIASQWEQAYDAVVEPEPAALPGTERSRKELVASINKGRLLFHDAKKGNCMSCHGAGALGDGQVNDYDDWNKVVVEFEDNHQQADLRALDVLPPRTIRPRNLRLGVYRFGRRPLDLFRRIHEGITGTPMPSSKGTLTPEEMWNVVDYVRSLPYEEASRPRHMETSIERVRM